MVQALLKFLTLLSHIDYLLGAMLLDIVLASALVGCMGSEGLSVGRM